MRIGILGSGSVGLTLGKGLIQLGHEVIIGTRRPHSSALQEWIALQDGLATAGTFRDAAEQGALILLCTSWVGTKSAIEQAGVWNFKNKTVVDVTNPTDNKGPDAEGRLTFVIGHNNSAGEQVHAWLPPDARVVKALSCIGYEHMFRPQMHQGLPTMFICGNSEAGKEEVVGLLRQMGWEDIADMGTIEMSRNIEPLCILWYAYGFRTGIWTHAFKMIK